MNAYIRSLILMITVNLLTGCGPKTDAESLDTPSIDNAVEHELTESGNNVVTENNCGSLKPLLKLLPSVKEMNGLLETYRGCENSSEQAVSVIYSNEGDQYTELHFKISVLNPESVYAKANLTIAEANQEQQAFINKAFKVAGDMHRSQKDICHHYDQNPMVPDGRNPLITRIQNLDACVMDNMDANKEIWNIFAIRNDLEFRLQFEGYQAGQILTTEIARNHLAPLFDQFGLGQIP